MCAYHTSWAATISPVCECLCSCDSEWVQVWKMIVWEYEWICKHDNECAAIYDWLSVRRVTIWVYVSITTLCETGESAYVTVRYKTFLQFWVWFYSLVYDLGCRRDCMNEWARERMRVCEHVWMSLCECGCEFVWSCLCGCVNVCDC